MKYYGLSEEETLAMKAEQDKFYPHTRTSDHEERIERDWARSGFAEGWRRCSEFKRLEENSPAWTDKERE